MIFVYLQTVLKTQLGYIRTNKIKSIYTFFETNEIRMIVILNFFYFLFLLQVIQTLKQSSELPIHNSLYKNSILHKFTFTIFQKMGETELKRYL